MPKPRFYDSLNGLVLPACLIILVLALAAGCKSQGSVNGQTGADAPVALPDAGFPVKLDGGGFLPSIDGGCATPASCTVANGRYCGLIGDGCGGALNCGGCQTGQTCVANVCTGDDGYDGGVLTSCTVIGGQYCGDIGNGAGGELLCGACTAPGWTCTDGICTAGPSICPPKVCTNGGSQYCGTIGDGCGHALNCGSCAAGSACVNNQCVPATNCKTLTCNPTGGQYCGGLLGDGCGGSMLCNDCTTPGWTCSNNLCNGGPGCKPTVACGTGAGKYCGTIGDGCGNSLACGDCIAGEVCSNNVCIPEPCTKLTCSPTGGQYCGGQVGDGCGGALDCSAPCPAGWTCLDHLCVGDVTCKRLTSCTNGTSFNYCGDVGDNCGGVLHCGNDCAAGQVCDTKTGLCKGDASCVPKACSNGTVFNYCGTIGDGCGGTLVCGDDCAKGQVCDATTNLCKGGPDCVAVACDNSTPFKYCGEAGDGCGGALHCGDDCAVAQVCGTDGVCKGDMTCVPITCDTGTGFNYCGTIGDGCGGRLPCPTKCAAGQECGVEGLCKGDANCVPKTCSNGTDFNYCGTIGDGCGGKLTCGTNCGPGKVCDTNKGLCKGDASCAPLTACTTNTEYSYCGTVGDGCGGKLDCPTDCGTGKVCDATKGLCQGDGTCVRLASCLNGTSFNYCGTIGDGCGGSLACSTDCGASKVCDTTKGLCKGDATCKPIVSCTNDTPFSYCGPIGDGCGGTLACPTNACGAGKVCDTTKGLCKGDATCTPVTSCANGTAYSYCGKIGDSCGGSLNCPATCDTNQVCDTTTGLCKGDSTCVRRTACTNDTAYSYCGKIGDGCGGSIDCSTDCGTGQVCDTTNHVCKGDSTCNKISCTNSQGAVQYCGGEIGDGCGGSLSCTGTCPAKTKCQDHVCVCDDGLRCQVATCATGSTTITGKVYDPAGANPLYNVMVFVPNTALPAIQHGPSCDQCPTSSAALAALYGDPVAAAVSRTDGSFTLTNAPSGTNIPLVFQIGKWRRQVTIPTVAACATTNVSTDDTPSNKFARLPRNQTDGDTGTVSLPKIAIAAGNAHPQYTTGVDSSSTERLQCLLRRIGVDTSEFMLPSPSTTGAIRLYNQSNDGDTCNQVTGISGTYPDATTSLWNDPANLDLYDMMLLNCGGSISQVDPNTNNTFISHGTGGGDGAVERMKAYVNAGGRVFAEHYHWAWIKSFPNYPSTFGEVATWSSSSGVIGANSRDTLIDTSFQRGQDFSAWLLNVGASTTSGHLTISRGVKYTAIDTTSLSRRWIYEPHSSASPTGAADYTHYFSFDWPTANACGRFVYTALHVSDSVSVGYANDPATSQGTAFPGCCASRTDLSPQEKALEFMIFDLSSCITTNGGGTPVVPPPPPPPPAPPAPPPPAPAPPGPPSAPPPPAPAPPPPAAPPPPPPASPPPPSAPSAPPPPPAPAPPAPPPPATTPPAPPSPPVPPPPPPPPPVASPPPPPPPPPAQAPPPPPPPPPPPEQILR